ncbi:TetR/AcrR family transcriptional regulator [Streptomyces abyssomicinicus]|uniref:TetR/AcrR family transcriptional regulator n=1 Tax=Streptomyces abyssomicinicus TaxID=574929 RepID=UPI001250ACD2|nr:TetR/AcrR family transcriptional regulator [Streptomyces abyssomicinicus]
MDITDRTAAPGGAPGLRERKKAATREAVHRAALRLTVQHGLDHVTVEAIADEAGVSRRTFSNYFATKEDAVLWGEEQQAAALLREVADRPSGESPWAALGAALRTLEPGPVFPDRETITRTRLALRHPSLLGRQLATHARLEQDLAAVLAGRGAEPLPSRVLAAAFLASMRTAMRAWVETEHPGELLDLVHEVLRLMGRPFDGPGAGRD